MTTHRHILDCMELIRDIESKPYFSPTQNIFHNYISELIRQGQSEQAAHISILSKLTEILCSAEEHVEEIIQQRISDGIIRDANQARKSVAGNSFQRLVAYSIAKNIILNNITAPVTVTLSGANNPLIQQYACINVGDEVQKPDSDVLVYNPYNTTSPIINFSCKTSCRERAGQTYKWKLLSDLATCECEYKVDNQNCPATKYQLNYRQDRQVLMCFVTADLYSEINNQQISGMFSFFDASYITKLQSSNISVRTFNHVIQNINNIYSQSSRS